MGNCTRCGATTTEAARFCAACGASLSGGPSSRRGFLAITAGTTALTGLGGVVVWRQLSRDGESSAASAPASERAAAPPASPAQPSAPALPEPPARPEPSLVDRYQPRLDRVHSAASYQAMATKSVAVAVIEAHAARATVDASQLVTELDAFIDDEITRSAELVLLGEHAGGLVGFCYRYLVDIEYPTIHAEADGVGTPEFTNPRLQVLGSTFTLARLEDDKPPPRLDEDTAWYRVFGEHDAALVYLPRPAELGTPTTLGLADPLAAVEDALANSSSLFGLDFVLMSPASFDAMRAQLAAQQARLDIAMFVAGVAISALVLLPLLGSATGVSVATLGDPARKLMAKALPVAWMLGRDVLLHEDGFVATHLGEDVRVALLGVEFPRDEVGLGLVQKFVAALLEQTNREARFVEFQGASGQLAGQIFMPERRMCLSAELLSRGLVRLDMSNRDVLLEFPELVTAALAAVEAGHERAGQWAKDDHDYVASLRTLNRVIAG